MVQCGKLDTPYATVVQIEQPARTAASAILEGRAIGEQRSEVLKKGERKANLAINEAIKTYGLENPVVKECLRILLCVARGEPGYIGRHCGERLRAVNRLLDQLAGRPREAPPAMTEHSDVDRYLADLVSDDED